MSEESWKNLLHAHIDGCLSKFDKLIQQQLRTWGLSSSFSIRNDSVLSLLILYRLIIFRKSFLLTIFSKKLNDFSSFSYVVELSCNIFVINAKIMKILTYMKKKNQAVQKSEFDSDRYSNNLLFSVLT